MNDTKIIVGRPIEGISLNGLEYLLDPEGDELLFNSIGDAKQMLSDNGIGEADLEECFVYEKVKMIGNILVKMEN